MGGRGWSSAITTTLYTLHPYSGGWWRLELHPADGGRPPHLCGDAKVSPLPHLCGGGDPLLYGEQWGWLHLRPPLWEWRSISTKGQWQITPQRVRGGLSPASLWGWRSSPAPLPTNVGEGEATHNCHFYGARSPALQRRGWRSAPPSRGIDPTSTAPLHKDGRVEMGSPPKPSPPLKKKLGIIDVEKMRTDKSSVKSQMENMMEGLICHKAKTLTI